MSATKKQTAVEWLIDKLSSQPIENINDEYWFGIIGEAKAMEKEQKEDMLIDIDIDLALIEDCAKGELGNSITELRIKIAKLLTYD